MANTTQQGYLKVHEDMLIENMVGTTRVQYKRYKENIWRLVIVISIFTWMFAMTPAFSKAATPEYDKKIDVMIWALYFSENRPQGALEVAIIYDSQNIQSVESAFTTHKKMQLNKGFRDITLTPALLDIRMLKDHELATYPVYFIANNIQEHYGVLNKSISSGHVVSYDAQCLKLNVCTLYIDQQKELNVVVNQNLANERHTLFKSAFVKLVGSV